MKGYLYFQMHHKQGMHKTEPSRSMLTIIQSSGICLIGD